MKGRIHGILLLVQQQLGDVKEIIKSNLRSGESPEGLLTGKSQAYVDCLELKNCELEELFQQDAAFWRENLSRAKNSQDEI